MDAVLVQIAAAPFFVAGIVCLCVFVGAACYAVVYAVRLWRYNRREKRQAEIRNLQKGKSLL
jgi:hypothetical protein